MADVSAEALNTALGIDAPVEQAKAGFDWDQEVEANGFDAPVKLSELRDGYLRQSDYTKKTQELAANREDYELFDSFRTQLETDPQGTLAKVAEQYGWTLSEAKAAVEAAKDEGAQLPKELQDELSSLREFQKEWSSEKEKRQAAEFQAQVTNEISRLTTEFGEFDEVELLDFATKRNTPDLELALMGLRSQKAYADGKEKGLKTAVARTEGSLESGSGDQSGAPGWSSFEELWAQTKAKLAG